MQNNVGTHTIGPIHVLPDDLLALIFDNNISPTARENSGLKDTLVASRVCRSWRALLLSSPSLWASLIDLGCLTLKGISEVMNRTGDAPLSVYANESLDYTRACEHLLPILAQHFHRIRHLRIFINLRPLTFEMGRPVYPTIKSSDWEPLFRAAPYLEHFDLTFHSWRRRKVPIFRPGLFGGQAARLRTLCVSSSALHPLDLNAPWVPQLRHLEFKEEQVLESITSTAWLSALKSMPQLEFFALKSNFMPFNHFTDEESTFPSDLSAVYLPSLTNLLLDIRGLMNATLLLKYILPAPNCRMHLTVNVTEYITPPGEELSELQTLFTSALSSHLQRWFSERITPSSRPSISLDVDVRSITVELQPCLHGVNASTHASLPWHLRLDSGYSGTSSWTFPLDAFSPFDLGVITELELGTDSAARCDSSVVSFLRSLCNVHTLRAGAKTLDVLASVGNLNPLGLSESEGILFPELECVKVKYLIQDPATPSSRSGHEPSRGEPETELWRPVRSFLDWRERMGSPVRVLDLTDRESAGKHVPELGDSNGMGLLYIRSWA
ncbi:unnamed protein product [Cyclocybe aegerita]|uniref:F-box domain-containing protein n=1 Tax=Cyclocybe aegerita TaxID=1973307 RepID=A0A8S0WF72_CYCAE|nr:unnamed protein product [Cyclocybe aegerita]